MTRARPHTHSYLVPKNYAPVCRVYTYSCIYERRGVEYSLYILLSHTYILWFNDLRLLIDDELYIQCLHFL